MPHPVSHSTFPGQRRVQSHMPWAMMCALRTCWCVVAAGLRGRERCHVPHRRPAARDGRCDADTGPLSCGSRGQPGQELLLLQPGQPDVHPVGSDHHRHRPGLGSDAVRCVCAEELGCTVRYDRHEATNSVNKWRVMHAILSKCPGPVWLDTATLVLEQCGQEQVSPLVHHCSRRQHTVGNPPCTLVCASCHPAENCCRFRPYRSRDYGSGSGSHPSSGSMLTPTKGKAGSGSRSPKKLQPMDSNSSETVAVISLGGSALQPGRSAVQMGQIVKAPAASREVRKAGVPGPVDCQLADLLFTLNLSATTVSVLGWCRVDSISAACR